MQAQKSRWLGRRPALLPVVIALVVAASAPMPADAGSRSGGQPPAALVGKSHLTQDGTWLAAKRAGRIRPAGVTTSRTAARALTCCSASMLDVSVTQNTIEPLGNNAWGGCVVDAARNCYVDGYMWNLCAEGATTNALSYWGVGINSHGWGWYRDPHTTTVWNDSSNRSYLMYLATQTRPPSFGTPGEFAYGPYPHGTTYQGDIRDTLNWEASGHSAYWSNFFYALVWSWNLSQDDLRNFVGWDIADGVALVADVNAAHLPSWSTGGRTVNHEIAIVGYDDWTGTYAYLDTCGTLCGSNGAGLHSIPQWQLYQAIEDNPYGGGQTGNIIW